MKICQIWSINNLQSCWKQQSSDQFIIETETLSSLNKNTILLIYQFSVFNKSEYWFTQIIISQSSKILQFIIKHYTDSFSTWYFLLMKLIIHQEKSIDLNFLNFQISWFLDNKKFKINKTQINFLIIIAYFLDHLFYLD